MAKKSWTEESLTKINIRPDANFSSRVGRPGTHLGNIAKVGALPSIDTDTALTKKEMTEESVND